MRDGRSWVWSAVLLAGLLGTGESAMGGEERGGEAAPVLVWIVPEAGAGSVAFRAMAGGAEAQSVAYRLRVTKAGGGGRSTTAQGGTVALPGGDEAVVLSTVAVNLGRGTAYSIELEVQPESGPPVRATLSSPPDRPL